MNAARTETSSKAPAPDYEVLIIGAGFSGIGAAIKLKQHRIDSFAILEQAGDLGGTWRDNTYPGIAVDIPSFVYSYSFEQNPNWSRTYAAGNELKAYAEHCARKYDVMSRIQFNATVTRAVFDEAHHFWRVYVRGGKPLTGRYLVGATGGLVVPKVPQIPGIDTFRGTTMHTARWDHTCKLTDRRVAVIGTGASGIQVVAAIVDAVQHLAVYQRTPIWILPKLDYPVPAWVQFAFRHLPLAQRSVRLGMYGLTELLMVGGAVFDRQLPFLTKAGMQLCRYHLKRQVKDPVLRKKLTPAYDLGCKRPSFSNGYWAAFNRSNVELVTDGIDHIAADGIVTKDGAHRRTDVIVLATGFRVFEKGNMPTFKLVGRNGAELGDFWDKNRYQAYEGITVPNFPNYFMMLGPYSFVVTSFFATMEAHATHLVRCITEANRRRATCVEIKQAHHDAYFRNIQRRMKSTVLFNSDCSASNSYYFDRHGDAPILRPSTSIELHWRSRFFDLNHYQFT
jgi:cation diffusion facilitator CzcD-associated flavoprotein CzcO